MTSSLSTSAELNGGEEEGGEEEDAAVEAAFALDRVTRGIARRSFNRQTLEGWLDGKEEEKQGGLADE